MSIQTNTNRNRYQWSHTMLRIGNPITELRDSTLYKLVANILTFVMFMNISVPAYAITTTTNMEQYLEGSVRYEFTENDQDALFKSIFESNDSFIFDGFDYFFEQAKSNIEAFEDIKYLPVLVGGITTMVPTVSKPKFIGTAYVERGIIKRQVYQLLNKSWITNPGTRYKDFNDLTKGLYTNALDYLESNSLKFGQNLSQSQIDKLAKDIIWPEKRTLSTGVSVYIPMVYLSKTTIASNKLTGSTFSFDSAEINTHNFIVNGAKIEARRNLIINTINNFTNIANGEVTSGGDLTINSGNELSNLSGKISGQTVTLIANKLTNNTLVSRFDYGHGFTESFDTLGVVTSIGDLTVQTSGDLVSHGGQFDTQASMRLAAGGNVILRPQQANSHRYEEGHGWTDSESSLVNLQTQLSAIDLLSIVTDNGILAHGAIIKSEGILELLAGKGITVIPAEDIYSSSKTFKTSGSGVFGSDESESEDRKRSEIVRSLLKAGNSLVLKTEQGNIVMKAASVDSRGIASLIAKNGAIDFQLAKLIESLDVKKSFEGSLSFRYQGHGYQREVAYYNEFITSGGLMLDASNGVRIEYAGNGEQSLDEILNNLAESPELAWMQEVRNNPDIDPVVWEEVELVLEEWDYDQAGLTPAAMALISVALAVATGGAGLTIMTGQGALVASVNAGFSALVTQSTTSLLANGGDIGLTLKELGSKDSLKSLAATMITAGVLDQLNTDLFTDVPNGDISTSSFSEFSGLDVGSLQYQISQRLIQTSVSTTLNQVITTGSFDGLDKSLMTGLMLSSVSFLGEKLANKIGLASSNVDSEGNPKEIDINLATQYIAHAALGCALGSVNTAINGGNSDAAENGCYSGAGGAVIGEYIAKNKRAELEEKKELVDKYLGKTLLNLKDNPEINTTEKFNQLRNDQYKELMYLKQQGIDIARLTAGIAIFAFGGDTQQAIDTAENAAKNNAFFIPVLIWATNAALLALTIYDFVESVTDISKFIKNGDRKAAARLLLGALVDAGIDISIGKLAGVVKATDKIEDIINKVDFDQLLDSAEDAFKNKGMDGFADEVRYLKDYVKDSDISDDTRPYKGMDLKAPKNAHLVEDFHAYRNAHPNAKLNFENWEEKTKTQYINENGNWVNYNGPSGKKIDVFANGKEISLNRGDIDLTQVNRKVKDLDGNNIDTCNFDCVANLRQEAQARSKQLDRNNPAHTAELNSLDIKKRNYSEQLGEMASEGYILKHYPGAVKMTTNYPGSNKKQHQFDQVWKTKDGEVIIPEAKGGVSIINGDRLDENKFKRVQQGTEEYNRAIIKEMEIWSEKNQNYVDKEALEAFNETLSLLKAKQKELTYIMIKQPVNATSGRPTDNIKVTEYLKDGQNDHI